MDAHLGFERLEYPGDQIMVDLYEGSTLSWCTLPLGAEPPATPGAWAGRVAFLRSIGWGLAPLYRAQLCPERGRTISAADQGRADAVQAAHRAIRSQLVDGDVVYLDVPDRGALPCPLVDYARAWFHELSDRTPFRPGVRCSHDRAAAQLRDTHPDLLVWVVNTDRPGSPGPFGADGALVRPDLAECGYPEAIAWQHLRACVAVPFFSAEGAAGTLDALALAVALVADPSRPDGPPARSPAGAPRGYVRA